MAWVDRSSACRVSSHLAIVITHHPVDPYDCIRFGVAREFCRRRLSLSAGVLMSGLVIALWGSVRLAGRIRAPGLPPGFATQLASHAVATAAEAAAVAAAEPTAQSDSVTAARAVVHARIHEARAKAAAKRANPLAWAVEWEAAYEARSREVSELLSVDASKDTALVAAEHRGTALEGALRLTQVRAAQTDMLPDESVRVLRQGNACAFRCRARRLLYVGTLVGAVILAHNLGRHSG